jgi:hypothetical protein
LSEDAYRVSVAAMRAHTDGATLAQTCRRWRRSSIARRAHRGTSGNRWRIDHRRRQLVSDHNSGGEGSVAAMMLWTALLTLVYVRRLPRWLSAARRRPTRHSGARAAMCDSNRRARRADRIEARIEEPARAYHPRNRLQIIVGSDGSSVGPSAGTAFCRRDRGRLPTRRGESAVLMSSCPLAR